VVINYFTGESWIGQIQNLSDRRGKGIKTWGRFCLQQFALRLHCLQVTGYDSGFDKLILQQQSKSVNCFLSKRQRIATNLALLFCSCVAFERDLTLLLSAFCASLSCQNTACHIRACVPPAPNHCE
jgi:hypothetical protein